jgi:ribose transport system ATP-binding protein
MTNIIKSFPGVLALNDVNFDLDPGEVHALVGENGAGKSTLMKILSGAYQPDSGLIQINGKEIRIKNPHAAHEAGISIIYQEFNLIRHLSVAENIFLGQEPLGFAGFLDRKKILHETNQILQELGLTIHADALISQLSIAEQQMVEVAKALLYQSKILIMDEPTSALSSSEIETLFHSIRQLRHKNVGIIYISHRLDELFQIADRLTVLRDGNYIGTYKINEINKQKLIKMMANRDLKEYYPRKRPQPGSIVLEVSALNISGKLRDINFHLNRGEILGMAGLVGAGRTELARAIFGLNPIDSGTILINGHEIRIHSPQKAIRSGIGFLTEDRKQLGLVLKLSVKENISLPNLDKISRKGFVKWREEKELAIRFVNDLAIKTPSIQQKVNFLSGGNQQKVVLSKWIARHLDIIIFDEPTRGIDVASKVEIYQLMNRLTEQGVGIIMISSELPEILGMSDRILVMKDGQIVAEFDTSEVDQEAILTKALGGAA